MSVVNVQKDPTNLTMTMTCEFRATPERVWQLWADPRQLERWWGPPEWPATFPVHDLRPGGQAEFYMTGPEGDRSSGYWLIDVAEPPRYLEIRDGFTNPDGSRNDDLPGVSFRVTIEEIEQGRTRMVLENSFASLEAMETLLEMGMDEGMTQALGQIDAILKESKAA